MSNVFVIIKMCYVHNQCYDISCAILYIWVYRLSFKFKILSIRFIPFKYLPAQDCKLQESLQAPFIYLCWFSVGTSKDWGNVSAYQTFCPYVLVFDSRRQKNIVLQHKVHPVPYRMCTSGSKSDSRMTLHSTLSNAIRSLKFCLTHILLNLLKPIGYVMNHKLNIQ